MKGAATLVCLCSFFGCSAQFNAVPYVGIISPELKLRDFYYESGGTSVVAGLELQWSRKASVQKRSWFSLASDMSYFANEFIYVENDSYTNEYGEDYRYKYLDIQSRYCRVALSGRMNWRPFPLIESYSVFAGLGLSNSYRLNAEISEEKTMIHGISSDSYLSNVTPEAGNIQHFQYDNLDATHLGNRYSLYGRLEAGMRYERVQICIRVSRSLTDTYFTGLEEQPQVTTAVATYWGDNSRDAMTGYLYPSNYVTMEDDFSPVKMKELHVEFILGLRLVH